MSTKKPLSEVTNDLKALNQRVPVTEEDITKWLGHLDLTFEQTADAINNIFDNKTLENEI